MLAFTHRRDTLCEALEVRALARAKRIPLEEWYDLSNRSARLRTTYRYNTSSVVVGAVVWYDLTDSEKLLQLVEAPDAPGSLRHHKFVLYLNAGLVAFASQAIALPDGTQ